MKINLLTHIEDNGTEGVNERSGDIQLPLDNLSKSVNLFSTVTRYIQYNPS